MRCPGRWLVVGLFLHGCGTEPNTGPVDAPPTVIAAAAMQNPENAISAFIELATAAGDSARIEFAESGGAVERTPFQAIRPGVDTIVALGLRPGTSYTLTAEVSGPGGSTRSPELAFTTGPLPPALAALRLTGTGTPSAGYTMIVPVFLGGDTTAYLLIFDESGALAWYHIVRGQGGAVEAKQQPNDNFSLYVGRSFGWQPVEGRFLEVQPDGEVVRTHVAAAPYYTDPHDLILSIEGEDVRAVHLLGYEVREYDTADPAGGGRTSLAIHRILRQSPSGQKLFEWNAGEHFAPADWPAASVPFDLVHPSSLTLAQDGNYLVSLQAMNEIAKIDARTGAFVWRFGGRHSDFIVDGDPLGGFQGQHSVRELSNGNLLMFDNRSGPDPLASRAVEYQLDHETGAARMVWEFRPDPPITSRIMGSVQRLVNTRTLIGFGVAARILEVTAQSSVTWDAMLTSTASAGPVQFYRAVRIGSLYRFEIP
jgi:hypothetical protein